MTSQSTVWGWASLLAGVLALWLSYSPNGTPYIPNDGYQYLDAASNLASGPCFCTRVALFDEQVAFGRFPIPFTHFAPGYPLLIAAVSRTGMAAETAGYLLSALGFLAVIWLIQDLGLALGARGWVAALFSLIWITQATALLYASSVGTETLFTAMLLGLVVLIVRDVRSDGARSLRMFGIGAVAGLAYWIRYPGCSWWEARVSSSSPEPGRFRARAAERSRDCWPRPCWPDRFKSATPSTPVPGAADSQRAVGIPR